VTSVLGTLCGGSALGVGDDAALLALEYLEKDSSTFDKRGGGALFGKLALSEKLLLLSPKSISDHLSFIFCCSF
jgi:hypothetical protein